MTDSVSKYLEAWLQSIRMVYPSAFYNLVYDKLNAFNDAYSLLSK